MVQAAGPNTAGGHDTLFSMIYEAESTGDLEMHKAEDEMLDKPVF